jgi:hypothetical protein
MRASGVGGRGSYFFTAETRRRGEEESRRARDLSEIQIGTPSAGG